MKKKVLTIMTAFVLMFVSGAQAAQADTTSAADLLLHKPLYHTAESDYESGDCLLSATRIMIRRAGVMNNDKEWEDLTNAKLRPKATEDGLMHNSFDFTDDGITYSISTGTFKGKDSAARVREFEELVNAHPEGVVVYGGETTDMGPHGVLLVDVVDGVVFASDTSNNMGDRNLGIQKWNETTMLDPLLCTDYWYISKISGGQGGTVNFDAGNSDAESKPKAETLKDKLFNPIVQGFLFA